MVVECSNCGIELIRAYNGSKETYTANLPCLDEGCVVKIRESEMVAVETTENPDAGFPTSPDERLFLSHLREISGKVL